MNEPVMSYDAVNAAQQLATELSVLLSPDDFGKIVRAVEAAFKKGCERQEAEARFLRGCIERIAKDLRETLRGS